MTISGDFRPSKGSLASGSLSVPLAPGHPGHSPLAKRGYLGGMCLGRRRHCAWTRAARPAAEARWYSAASGCAMIAEWGGAERDPPGYKFSHPLLKQEPFLVISGRQLAIWPKRSFPVHFESFLVISGRQVCLFPDFKCSCFNSGFGVTH